LVYYLIWDKVYSNPITMKSRSWVT